MGPASIHQERTEAPDQEIGELVDALRAAAEPRAAAIALAGCLRRMLAADAVSIHVCQPGQPPALVAAAGTPAPPLAARVAEAASGGAPAGGFSVRGPDPPGWLFLFDPANKFTSFVGLLIVLTALVVYALRIGEWWMRYFIVTRRRVLRNPTPVERDGRRQRERQP